MKAVSVTRRIYLDPDADNLPPVDSQRICTERAFWEYALVDQDLYIQCDYLCVWAKIFFEGRGQAVHILQSPSTALRTLCPQLTADEAKELLAQAASLPEGDLALTDYARSIFGGDWWTQRPSLQHVAHWLLWWLEHAPNVAQQKLLAVLARYYQRASHDSYATGYAAQSSQEATKVLYRWLGYVPDTNALGVFPLELPDTLLQHLRSVLAERVVDEGIAVFKDLQQRNADKRLLKLAAAVTADYLEHHPSEISVSVFGLLNHELTNKQSDMLRDLLPLQPPSAPPETFPELVAWFLKDYLPYRTHSKHDSKAIAQLGRAFAERYIQLYLAALSGSPDKAYLSWQRVHQHDPARATLIVVLDGLSVIDMEYFWRHFNEQNSGTYRLLTRDVALAVLPSITEVAKPPLFYQCLPKDSQERHKQRAETAVPVLRKDEDLLAALQHWQVGQVLIWSLQEPDKNYHQHQQQETAKAMAQASIGGIIQRLMHVLEQIPENIPLDFVISTDHGRLLGESQRTIPAPKGMQAQGRAALGESQQHFPEQGYFFQEDIVFLHAGRFKLATDAAMLISQDSFLTNDGKRGTLAYPHGGILPEEVLIPCWRVARSYAQAAIKVTLQGSAQAGKRAVLTLIVKNPNRTALSLQNLVLSESYQLPLDSTAPAMVNSEHEVIVETWLSLSEAQQLTPLLHYQAPDGGLAQADVTVRVDTQEMYTQEDILGELL